MQQIIEEINKQCIECEYDIMIYFNDNINRPYEKDNNKTRKIRDSFNELKRLYKKILNGGNVDEKKLVVFCKETFTVLPKGFQEWINKLKMLNILKSKKMIAYYMSLKEEELQMKKDYEIKKYSELIMLYEWVNKDFFQSDIPASDKEDACLFYELFKSSVSNKMDGDVAYIFYLNEFSKYNPKDLLKMLKEWKNNPESNHDDAKKLKQIHKSLYSRREKLINMTLEEFRQYKMLQLSTYNRSILPEMIKQIQEDYDSLNSIDSILLRNNIYFEKSGVSK